MSWSPTILKTAPSPLASAETRMVLHCIFDALISSAVWFFFFFFLNILLELVLCAARFQKDTRCWREGMEGSVFSILKGKNSGARKAL